MICTGPKPNAVIHELTLEELRQYDCGSLKNPHFPKQKPVPGTRVPTLDEVRSLRTNNQLDLYEAGLKTLTQSPDAQTKGRALTLLALFYIDQKRTADALPVLGQAADADPLVAPWLRLRIVDIDAAAGKWADALFTATRIIQDTPASSAATRCPVGLSGAGGASSG